MPSFALPRPRTAVRTVTGVLLPALALTACSVDDSTVGSASTGAAKASASASPVSVALHPLDTSLQAKLPAAYREKGHLDLGVSEYSPYNTFDSDGRVTGLVPDLAAQFSSMLGVKITVEKTTFDAVVPSLKSGRLDLSAPAGDFVERQQQVDFADFAKSNVTVMVNTATSFKPRAGLDLCGRKVAVEKGAGTQNVVAAQSDKCRKAGKKDVDEQVFADLSSAALALQSKRVDAVAAPTASNTAASAQSSGRFATVKIADMQSLPAATAIYGFEAKKGSGLAAVLAQALRALHDDGTYDKLFAKWSLTLSTIDASKITVNGSDQHQSK
ncbi:glutamine ABC transporter substrate-binding protein [Streptomyces hygroscopicus]|uniref:transporter substrate-binding domain-containing protein n=1 Tax=Streptomyces hygroscopicus TaxID=1912 RepID=UPI00223F5623|nr:transporter substrate-binding domain-containing protein [Streptomyces hygroscopicus]MCW7947020.1 glutamine ABC transporter substrate-binding protein [Streptomyces hygroscopicus]